MVIIYRLPKKNIREGLQKLENSISFVLPQADETFIIGDLILNVLKKNVFPNLLTDLFSSFNLKQTSNKTTFLKKIQDHI